jgi:16S rRNA G966 N2-methylase RsmD
MAFEIIHGDALEVLKGMEANSVDAVVTDPPYGIAFMGKKWDYDVPTTNLWAECLRVLKPGGHLLAFAGTRTQHRMAVRIEDAGFDIRDMIAWVYGSGFPKSMDVSKAIDKAAGVARVPTGRVKPGHEGFANLGTLSSVQSLKGTLGGEGGFARPWMDDPEKVEAYHQETAPGSPEAAQWQGWGTALKPSMETITVARKPLVGTVAENVLTHGTGALNIDGCRVELEADCRLLKGGTYGENRGSDKGTSMFGTNTKGLGYQVPSANSRWPANLIHDGSDEVLAAFPDAPGQQRSTGPEFERNAQVYGKFAGVSEHHPRNDSGSAARFFKTCEHDDFPLLLCDAKAIFGAWKTSPANTAESPLHQPSPSADFVRDLVLFAEYYGATLQSRRWTEHFTNATPIELSDLCALVTMAILFTEARSWRVSQPARHTLSNSRVSIAETNEQTGITTITIDRWTSDGFAEVATFGIMPLNAVRGEAASASRLVYCAKASKSDRGESNGHPTVKPTELMRYLVRLVTQPGGTVLDPFTGSGSTGKAAVLEGFEFIGIEREAEYVAIAEARIVEAQRQLGLFA